MRGEQAAPPERDAHGFKIIRTHCIAERRRIVLRVVFVLKFDAITILISAQWQLAGEGHGSHARNALNRLPRLFKELVAGCVRIEFVAGFLDLHGQQLGGMKAGIH